MPTNPTTITLDPVTRLEGHLKIEVTVDLVNGRQEVVNAKATGTLFRGFEAILANRDPLDAPDITQRICGVCPVSHGLAAVSTLENAARFTVPENARIMRNLVLGSNYIQSHILHFYHLAVPDFVNGPNMPPWQPSWQTDKHFTAAESTILVNHYVKALEMRRKAHEMGALFGGRLPHPPAFVPGGFTTTPRAARISKFKSYLSELITFINNTYLPDVSALAGRYPGYSQIGRGSGNLLAYGVFDLDSSGANKLLRRGRIINGAGQWQTVTLNAITEQVTYSWYNNANNNLPPASGATTPQYPKLNAYSWLKAPRYQGEPYEVGPLARMFVNGDYVHGISVLDRHAARAEEALKIATAMEGWVSQLNPSGPVYQRFTTPASASGVGLTEAPRGAPGHWVRIANGRVANYQVVTPTCWNASPRDGAGKLGPIEKALIGAPVENLQEPIEVLRVIHSFDPCLSCAVHVMRPAEGVKIFALGHYHTEDEEHAHGRAHQPSD
jgi:hydrogenase large subunit